VWLKADPETILARVNADVTTAGRRPNLTAHGGLNEIRQLLAQREPFYRECASAVVETAGRDLMDVTEEVASIGMR
jgi:shikimate kinase